MIEFYNFEIVDMQCQRILDLIDEIRTQYIESEDVLPKESIKDIEIATIDMSSAVLKLRRAQGILRKYRI